MIKSRWLTDPKNDVGEGEGQDTFQSILELDRALRSISWWTVCKCYSNQLLQVRLLEVIDLLVSYLTGKNKLLVVQRKEEVILV